MLKDSYDKRVYMLIRRSKKTVAILPVVQNATLGKWDGIGLAKLLADPQRSSALIKQLGTFVQSHKLQGIVVDFEIRSRHGAWQSWPFLGCAYQEFPTAWLESRDGHTLRHRQLALRRIRQ